MAAIADREREVLADYGARTSVRQGEQARQFSKSPKIRSTVSAATAPKIPKDINGTSRLKFLNLQNQEGEACRYKAEGSVNFLERA
jgi:hypothetical protein